MRNRGDESSGKASTTCCAVQAAVGAGHVEMYDSAAVMEKDYEHVEHRNVAVGRTKKSTETRSRRDFRGRTRPTYGRFP